MAQMLSVDGVISVFHNGEMFKVTPEHANYNRIRDAVKVKDYETVVELYDVVKEIETSSDGKVTVTEEGVTYNGRVLHSSLADRMVRVLKEGFDVKPFTNFLENLMQNPSARAVEELYNFLDRQHLPITDDGCFLAYKSVQSDFYSKTAGNAVLVKGKEKDGRIYNGIGEVIEVVRNQVDDNRDHHCSYGLHVGAVEYAGPGGWFNESGDRVVIVKVNPRDAVSVPTDYSFSKLRTCKYEVISEYKQTYQKAIAIGSDDDYEEFEDEVFLEFDDMVEGHEYEFEYDDKIRTVLVEEKKDDEILAKLIYPEPHDGEYRTFKANKIEYIVKA